MKLARFALFFILLSLCMVSFAENAWDLFAEKGNDAVQ